MEKEKENGKRDQSTGTDPIKLTDDSRYQPTKMPITNSHLYVNDPIIRQNIISNPVSGFEQ